MPADRKSRAAYIGRPDHHDSALEMLIAAAFPWIETEADLDRANRCQRVTSLNLIGIGSDEMMSMLGRFPKLSSLHIDDAITEVGYATLPNHSKLEDLFIVGRAPSPSCMRHLAECHRLEDLYLTLDHVDWDELLSDIAAIPNLSSIALLNSELSDRHVSALSRLSRLKSIYVTGSEVSAEDEERLKAALPGVDVGLRP